MTDRAPLRWAVQWRSRNRLDGTNQHFMWNGTYPLMFETRAEAREFVETRYGYIRKRADLQNEPHGWEVPRVVRVQVQLVAVTQ